MIITTRQSVGVETKGQSLFATPMILIGPQYLKMALLRQHYLLTGQLKRPYMMMMMTFAL